MFCYHPTFKFIQIHKKLSDAIEEGSDICKLKTEDNVEIRKLFAKCMQIMTIYEINYIFSVYGEIENIELKENSGKLNDKRRTRNKLKQKYCFVTFKDPKSATRVLMNRQGLSEYFEIKPADSWHQPDYVDPKLQRPMSTFISSESRSSVPENSSITNILELNNDCLLKIFSHLDIYNLILLKNVCTRFSDLIQIQLKTTKSLNFDNVRPNFKLTLLDLKNILSHVGPNLKNLCINSSSFNSNNNDRILQMIPFYCRKLEILKISGFKINKSAKSLKFLISRVQELDLSDNSEMSDDFLDLRRNSRISKLNLSNNNLLNGKCLLNLKSLTSLNISNCKNVQGKNLKELCKDNQLKELDISECNNLNGNDVNEVLLKYGKSLESLNLNNFYADTNEIIIPNISGLENLKKLQICNVHYPGEDQLLSTLNQENKIEVLEIPYGNLTQSTLNALIQMRNLRILNLNFKRSLLTEDEELLLCHVFENNQSLEEIHLADANFANICILNAVLLLENLRFLDISRCFGINNEIVRKMILHLLDRKNVRNLTIKVGQTDVDMNILKDPLYRANKESINLVWSSTKHKEEFDYDIDETQSGCVGSQPVEDFNLDDILNMMSSFDNCSEEIIALIKQNL